MRVFSPQKVEVHTHTHTHTTNALRIEVSQQQQRPCHPEPSACCAKKMLRASGSSTTSSAPVSARALSSRQHHTVVGSYDEDVIHRERGKYVATDEEKKKKKKKRENELEESDGAKNERDAPMTIAISGGTGFVYKRLTEKLLEEGSRVKILISKATLFSRDFLGTKSALSPNVSVHKCKQSRC